jgi:tRNA 2-selenouridine synthase
LLDGGYKAFRNWVLEQFRKDFNFYVLGGYTGSGKTLVLHQLEKTGHAVLDLEGIANHKGSAFGALGMNPQPSSEMFENMVAKKLFELTREEAEKTIWIEDESQRIGNINMPAELWSKFRVKPLFFLDIPFEKRLDNIVKEYGVHSKEALLNAIVRIQKRLGGLETKTAVNCLLENDTRGCFEILLKYYDKHYSKALHNRPGLKEVIRQVPAENIDAISNTQKILSAAYEHRATATGS